MAKGARTQGLILEIPHLAELPHVLRVRSFHDLPGFHALATYGALLAGSGPGWPRLAAAASMPLKGGRPTSSCPAAPAAVVESMPMRLTHAFSMVNRTRNSVLMS